MRRLVVVAGLLVLVLCVWLYRSRSTPGSYSERTSGTITEFIPAFRTRSHMDYYVQAEYRDAKGVKHSCVSDWGVTLDYFKIGDQIPVRYVKDNPSVSYLPPPRQGSPLILVLAGIGLGVIVVPRLLRLQRMRQGETS